MTGDRIRKIGFLYQGPLGAEIREQGVEREFLLDADVAIPHGGGEFRVPRRRGRLADERSDVWSLGAILFSVKQPKKLSKIFPVPPGVAHVHEAFVFDLTGDLNERWESVRRRGTFRPKLFFLRN